MSTWGKRWGFRWGGRWGAVVARIFENAPADRTVSILAEVSLAAVDVLTRSVAADSGARSVASDDVLSRSVTADMASRSMAIDVQTRAVQEA